MGVTHVSNGDGTVTQFDADTGQELVTFPDPDGSFTRDHLEPAAASAATPQPQGSNAERVFKRALELSPASQTVRPDQETVTPQAPESEFRTALNPPAQPSERGPAQTPTGIQTPALPIAGQETTGLTEEDRAARAQARGELRTSEERAAAAQGQAEQEQLAAREQRVQAESDRALGRYASDLELHETAKQKLLEAEDFAKQARATPIDPGQALGGDKFFYAIMAGVGASLSNFGAHLLGQQGNADTNMVDDIVAAGVKQQMADRQLNVEGAQDDLDSARKQELRLGIQANASLEKWFEAQAQVERNPELRAAYASKAEERRAAIDRDSFQLAEKEYKTAVQKQAVPKPVAGAGANPAALLNPETKEDRAALAENGLLDAKGNPDPSYAKYADERQKLGADATLKHVSDLRQIVKDLKEKGSTDVPGVGPIDQATQGLLRSNDASKVQQALGQVVTTFVKNRSGAAVTDKERDYLQKIIVGTSGNQAEGLENGLRHIEAEVKTQLGVLNTGRSSEARAYDKIYGNQLKRSRLSAEDSAGLEEQRRASAKPASHAERQAPAEPTPATPESVAEFQALPENNPGGEVRQRPQHQRTSREEELRQLLEE